jgi:hypothetical protein
MIKVHIFTVVKKMTNSRGEEKQYQVILYARSHLTQP